MGKTQKPKPKTNKGKSGSSISSKTNSKGGAVKQLPRILVKPQSFASKEAHAELARRKIWLSKDGNTTNYENLDKVHLDNINDMLQDGRASTRKEHKDGIKQEKLRRETKAGKVLYGEKNKDKQ